MIDKETEALINAYQNGTASKGETEMLEKRLLEDAALRDHFSSLMNLDAALREEAEQSDLFEAPQVPQTRKFPSSFIAIAAAIAVLLTLNLTYLVKNSSSGQATVNVEEKEPLQSGLALVTGVVDVHGDSTFAEGQTLEKGRLSFESGILQVDFFSGATLIFEGPAEVNLIDSMNIECRRGKIRARVSEQARGFKIRTSDLDVVDLGTEFALDIPDKGQASVFVYEGEVELQSKIDSKILKSLLADNGVTWKNEEISAIPMRDDFVTFESIAELSNKFSQVKLKNWHNYADKIRQREDVILFYSFEKENNWSRTLKNESINQQDGLDGAIVGCRWSQGRWPGKGALDFKSTGDRIKLNIPGTYDDITFSCWVKVESFDRWLSSLLLTDDYNAGELHWQLSDSGEIILGANSNGNTFSPPVIAPKDLGRWIHIATVYNSKKKEIVHYLNGTPVVKDTIKKLSKIKLGKSDIGNWTTKNKNHHHIRSLNGRLDEFIIFSSPLSDSDISSLYRLGLPE